MPRYKTCPICGAHLDPSEHCRCDQDGHDPPDLEEAHPRSLPRPEPITDYRACETVQRYRRYVI